MKQFLFAVAFVAVSLIFAPHVRAVEQQYQDVPPSGCGAIDPALPCYMTGTPTTCPAAYDYNSCLSNCKCVYNKNVKKCGTAKDCLAIAAEEKNACDTNCVADWS